MYKLSEKALIWSFKLKKVRILKISDGFVTNSSSVSATVLIAARKGKDLGVLFSQIGLSSDWVNKFYNDIDGIKEWFKNIEYSRRESHVTIIKNDLIMLYFSNEM